VGRCPSIRAVSDRRRDEERVDSSRGAARLWLMKRGRRGIPVRSLIANVVTDSRFLAFTIIVSSRMAPKTFADRPINKLVLFDVDGTLTPARQVEILYLGTVFSLFNLRWRRAHLPRY